MSSSRPIRRRRFLGLAAGVGGAALLASCGGGGNPQAPRIGGSTPAAGGGGTTGGSSSTVYTLVDKTWVDVGMGEATKKYNATNPGGPQITLEEVAEGWETKVLAQVREKNLRWSGHGYAAFFDQYRYIKAGLVQPLDEYLAASKVPWAQKQKESYFTPRIYDAQLFEGKQYFLPMKANVHLAGWRQDYLEAAGYNTMPKTWDEVDQMLPKLKAALSKDQVTPFAIQRDIFRCIGTTFATFIEKPFDDQGVLKFESPEWFQVMELFKKWMTAGLARFDSNTDSIDIWQKGKVAMSLGSHSWVRLGRQVWGPDKVKGGVPPQANASAPLRTWTHIDGAFVFPNAPNGQAATDWLLSILGPEGDPAEAWWKGVVTFSGQPVHQGMVDKAIKDKPELSEVYEVVEKALPNSQVITIPVAGAYNITASKMLPWLDRYFAGELPIKEAMAKTRAEVNEELAKQKG